MAGVRSQLVSLEAQLLELKSQIGAAQSQNANLVRENFALMQIEKHITEIMQVVRAVAQTRQHQATENGQVRQGGEGCEGQ